MSPSMKRRPPKRKPVTPMTSKPAAPLPSGPQPVAIRPPGPKPSERPRQRPSFERPPGARLEPRDTPAGRSRPRPMQPPIDRNAPERDAATAHVASLETLARAAIEAASIVERAVIQDQKHADRTLARMLKDRHDLGQ